jgi:hypothetical protein
MYFLLPPTVPFFLFLLPLALSRASFYFIPAAALFVHQENPPSRICTNLAHLAKWAQIYTIWPNHPNK